MGDINSCNIHVFDRLISEAERPVILTHMKPDGDAMGSSVAMYRFLKMLGKHDVSIVLNDRYPDYLGFLICDDMRKDVIVMSEESMAAREAIKGSDLLICLDFNVFHRTDKLEQVIRESTSAKVLIDHHLDPDRSAFACSFSETRISSASELLYRILMEMPQIGSDAGRLPAKAAEALMTGMTTDTNNFANSVFPSTLDMASALLAAGVDRDMILNRLYNQYSENRLRLMGHMMKDLLRITEDGVAYIVLDRKTQKEYGMAEGDTEGFVNMPLSIGKVCMSLLLKEDDDRIRVSIRSKKGISANRCARLHFNGGGHENAAGGKLNVPSDINSILEVPEYIERHTHTFLKEENEQ